MPQRDAPGRPGARQRIAALVAAAGIMAAVVLGRQQPPPAPLLSGAELEQAIHRPPGAAGPGRIASRRPERFGTLMLTVADASGRRLPCRVNVRGSDGLFYEPVDNPLAPWSLSRLGNRAEKGPFRYLGWFFYTTGVCRLELPPGEAVVEVARGLEYRPATARITIEAGGVAEQTVTLARGIDMAVRGWYSGDTHIHLDRRNDADDERCLDLAEAEEIRFAQILCMNDPRSYRPLMEQQIWFQRALGRGSVRTRGEYAIASGQEYRCATFGHICLIGHSRLVDADGAQTDPNNWPVFGLVGEETRALGGKSFHAHGGYEQEIYADFALGTTDGVELLQFAEYRGIGLPGWYRMLNAGFRFPAVGASDYPYCRWLGDCRTYARIDGPATFEAWNESAAAGRSFFTTGPLVEFTVDGRGPGETLARDAPGTVLVEAAVTSLVARPRTLQCLVNGRIHAETEFPQDASTHRWKLEVRLEEPAWLALRATGPGLGGREDVEAHTNPVYVTLQGRGPHSVESLDWLIAKLDAQIEKQAARQFPQRAQVLEYFVKARAELERRKRP